MTRAADQLAMTQPAVSNAVSRMRVAWNDPVFVKRGRGIMATPYARGMWSQVRAHMDELRELANPEPFDAANARRSFRIGTADINVGLMWWALRRRAEQFAPGIDFHAVPSSQATTEAQLINAEVDVAISAQPGNPAAGIREKALLNSYYVCAMRVDHPLAAETLSLESFVAADHLMVSLTGDATGIVDEILQARGLRRRVAMTVNHFFLVARLLKGSNLISTVPYEAVAEYACGQELRVVRPPIDIPPITLSMLWHERNHRDAGQRWLRDQIQAIARETKAALPTPACICQPPRSPTRRGEIPTETDAAVSGA